MGEARRTGDWHKNRFSSNRRCGTVNGLEGTAGNERGALSRLAHPATISLTDARSGAFAGARKLCGVNPVTIGTRGVPRTCVNGRDRVGP